MSTDAYAFIGAAKITDGQVSVCKTCTKTLFVNTAADFGGVILEDVGDPINPSDAATKSYVDSKWQGGVTLSGVLDMAGSHIINLATPTSPQDAATKGYVDSLTRAFAAPNVYTETSNTMIDISKHMHFFQPSLSTTTQLSFALPNGPAGLATSATPPPVVYLSNLSSTCTVTISGLFVDALTVAFTQVTLMTCQGSPFVWNGTAWQNLICGFVPGPASA